MDKVIFILGELPLPLDSGAKIRTFYILESLCKRYRVHLLGLLDGEQDIEKIKELKKMCAQVSVFDRKMKKEGWRFYRDLFFNIFSNRPYIIDRGYSSTMVKEIKKITLSEKIKFVLCDSLQLTPNILGIDCIKKILNTHNVESVIRKRHCEVENNIFMKIYMRIQLMKLEKYEAKMLNQFDHILAVSENDKNTMLRFNASTKSKIIVVPNGVDTAYFKLPEDASTEIHEEEAIAFTGSMDWLPNIDAVEYFCNDILPKVWDRNRNVKFYVIGKNPNKKIMELGKKNANIIITGTVDDVRPYMEKVKAFVVPLRIGGGTRLKILESMAMQKPVISTSIGCEGLDVNDGINITVADSAEEFAGSVIDILQDRYKAEKMTQKAHSLVKNKYDWQIITNDFLTIAEAIC